MHFASTYVIVFIALMMELLGALRECTGSESGCGQIIFEAVVGVWLICLVFCLVNYEIPFGKKGKNFYP